MVPNAYLSLLRTGNSSTDLQASAHLQLLDIRQSHLLIHTTLFTISKVLSLQQHNGKTTAAKIFQQLGLTEKKRFINGCIFLPATLM